MMRKATRGQTGRTPVKIARGLVSGIGVLGILGILDHSLAFAGNLDLLLEQQGAAYSKFYDSLKGSPNPDAAQVKRLREQILNPVSQKMSEARSQHQDSFYNSIFNKTYSLSTLLAPMSPATKFNDEPDDESSSRAWGDPSVIVDDKTESPSESAKTGNPEDRGAIKIQAAPRKGGKRNEATNENATVNEEDLEFPAAPSQTPAPSQKKR